jgi:hypothetical protein
VFTVGNAGGVIYYITVDANMYSPAAGLVLAKAMATQLSAGGSLVSNGDPVAEAA